MKRNLLFFTTLLLTFITNAQCDCNLLGDNFFTGDYVVTQPNPGPYGYAFDADGAPTTITLGVSSNPDNNNNERIFYANYLPIVSSTSNIFTLSFNNCEATFKANQETGLSCDGGVTPYALGPDTGGFYSIVDDTSFTVTYLEDSLGSCGAPDNSSTTLIFTKANATSSRVLIPDANFEQALVLNNIDDVVDGSISATAAQSVTSLSVNASNTNDLSGIEAFTNLQVLSAVSNFITAVDLSKNCNLQSVSLDNNSITRLDLRANTSLNYLTVTNNNLEFLNIQNSNNSNITVFDTGSNPNLTCIEVDNPGYATNAFTNIDPQTSFSISCSVDYNDLIALYNSTNGSNWTNTWDLSENIDTFYGVTVDANNRVTSIRLDNNNLTGTLPIELGNLSKLTSLELYQNSITGTIPLELANITNLVTLNLSANQLTGTIPTVISNLVGLNNLSLSDNQLTGTIPSTFGNLTGLSLLDLSRNQLTGTIPVELGNLNNLNWFYLYENNLTGTIPTELDNLFALNHLYLNGNELTGPIPSTIGNLTYLQHLVLSENQLSDTIPTTLGNLTSLTELSLFDNQLSGTIPNSLGSLLNLSQFLVNDNQLSGTIPFFNNINNLSINIADNNFVFIDFESDFPGFQSAVAFTYAPQNNFDIEEDITVDSGTTVTLTSRFANLNGDFPASTNNTYLWYKDDVALIDNTNPTLEITNVSPNDAGVYTLKVNNTVISGLEIDRNAITLNVNTVDPNYLLVKDTSIIKGNSENIDIQLVNSQDVRAFQFDIELPAGFVFNTADLIDAPRIADFQTSISDLGNNTFRILGFSFSNSIITPGDGAIVSLPTLVDVSVIAGDYTFDITNVVLSDVNNQNATTTPLSVGTVSVSDFPLGDSNGNSTVDVLDLLQTIDYILGNNPSPFNFTASDVNMDGVINVLDVVGIQDIILNPGNAQGENQGDVIVSKNAVMPMENYLLVTDQNVMQDSSTIVEIELENDDTIRAFQFDINLPAGFTLNTAGIAAVGRLSGFTVSSSNLGNNNFRILAFSFSGGTMAPGTGAILNLPVTVNASVAIGDYTLPMTGVVLSDVNNVDIASTPLSVGSISVTSTLGVNENSFNVNSIKMYPNPASDSVNLNIHNNYTGTIDFNLYDIAGKLIYANQVEKTNSTLDAKINTAQLSNGVYILNIKTKTNNISKRIVISK